MMTILAEISSQGGMSCSHRVIWLLRGEPLSYWSGFLIQQVQQSCEQKHLFQYNHVVVRKTKKLFKYPH